MCVNDIFQGLPALVHAPDPVQEPERPAGGDEGHDALSVYQTVSR